MNLAFYIIIILAVVLLWFLLSFTFFPIGRFFHRLGKDAIDEMNREDKKDKKENEKKDEKR